MHVYVFSDPRYERGIKVGKGKLPDCFHDAQGYAPGGLICLRLWSFPSLQQAKTWERAAHAALQAAGFPRLAHHPKLCRNGVEWFDATPDEGLPVLEHLFQSSGKEGLKLRTFRQDKVLSTPHRQGRLVLWIFKELLTDRLKISTCSEFASPRERARRYSRNGYEEVAAYVIPPPISLQTNKRLFDIRRQLLELYGSGERSLRFGWLREGVKLSEITSFLAEAFELEKLQDLNQRPVGVRPSYTGDSQVPEAEFSAFTRIWWRRNL